ncbi:hypothetical protein OG730_20900 [Streptomyces sp. NBC_01298]|uniref:hypothetical protein n=1 Tax=Streptomyces sp. NBC_01298 TaxID=2903817 RepID=UPI002E11998E|nr:hypothetical protein OG730_20900 [Streptomyces sp. NBC_01298]
MKKHLAKMTALAGLITALALAAVTVGQPGPDQATSQARGENSTTVVPYEIEWP